MRRAGFRTAVAVAVAAVLGGGAYAYLSYRSTSGSGQAVESYFAALARGDAPAALAYGDVPDGTHAFLTSDVLREQQRIARLHDVSITDVATAGSEVTVRFSYQLGYADRNQEVTGSVQVHDGGDGWRLDQAAVAVTLHIDQAEDRFTFSGTSVPAGSTLLFPGALPVRYSTVIVAPEGMSTNEISRARKASQKSVASSAGSHTSSTTIWVGATRDDSEEVVAVSCVSTVPPGVTSAGRTVFSSSRSISG